MKKLLFTTCLVLISILAVWLLIVVPRITRLSSSFSYNADIVSVDNFYNEALRAYQGDQYSLTKFEYEVTAVSKQGFIIRNIFDVRTPEGEPIISLKREYGVDPQTRSHVSGLGDKDRNGYLFSPTGLREGQSFTYWHINYDAPARMEYVSSENLYGLKVFRYTSNYGAQKIDQTENLTNLPEVGISRGVVLEPTLELWVEPTTGRLIKYKDDTIAYYYDLKTQEKIAPWNHFKNSYTEYSVQKQVVDAEEQKKFFNLITSIIPLIILFAIFVVLVFYIWGEEIFDLLQRRNFFIAITLVLVTGFFLTLTFILWILFRDDVRKERSDRFQNQTEQITAFIQSRINLYGGTVFGLQGLFSASENVEKEEWEKYVTAINVPKNFSGISSVSYVKRVLKSDKASYPYKIYPEANKDEYYPLTYSVYFVSNNPISFGLDFSSEEKRNQTIILARDQAVPAATPLVESLVTKVPIFSIYAPVYKNNTPYGTISERTKNLQGFIAVGFRAKELFEGLRVDPVFDPGIDVEVYDTPDVTTVSEKNLVFDSDPTHLAPDENTDLVRVTNVVVAGRIWTVYFSALPLYKGAIGYSPTVVLVSGIVLSIVMGIFVLFLILGRKNALNLVSLMTQDLKKSKDQLEIKLHETEKLNKFMVDREVKMIDLKQKIKELESGK